jgi:hypothetical protein
MSKSKLGMSLLGIAIGMVPLPARMMEWTYIKVMGHWPPVHWFMSPATRDVAIEATREFGLAFLGYVTAMHESDPVAHPTVSEDYKAAAHVFLGRIQAAAIDDPFNNDFFFRPTLLTRIERYLWLDGVPNVERKRIARRRRERLLILDSLRRMKSA